MFDKETGAPEELPTCNIHTGATISSGGATCLCPVLFIGCCPTTEAFKILCRSAQTPTGKKSSIIMFDRNQ